MSRNRKVAVVGALAAGMSAASQAKRRDPQAQVVVFERGTHISCGACGLPCDIQNPNREIEDLVVVSVDGAPPSVPAWDPIVLAANQPGKRVS